MTPLTDQQVEDNALCPTCRGNGKYQVYTTDGDGMSTMAMKFCETCGGTGKNLEDGDVD